MKRFATSDQPLRASSLPALFECPRSVVLRLAHEDRGNEAAQTGSVIHKGIQAYHTVGDRTVALAVIAAATAEFPLADTAKARKHFEGYCKRQDPQWGQVIECEQHGTLEIPGLDETQEAIVISGTLDQLRRQRDGSLLLVDIKTGSKRADLMLGHYTAQMAAYSLMASARHGGKPVRPAILRTADYVYGGPVLYRYDWDSTLALRILDPIKLKVAQVRSGNVVSLQGEHCLYCPARSPRHCLNGTIPDASGMDNSRFTSLADIL